MNTTSLFDPVLLRRYNISGPRYTSYPTAPQFHPGFGEAQFCEHLARSNAAASPGAGPRNLSLYLHIPFCFSPCFYCGCHRTTTHDFGRSGPYVDRLLKEAARVAEHLDRSREVMQLHLGGGTPNFLSPSLLCTLIEGLEKLFDLSQSPNRDFSIELDPRLIQPGDIAMFASLGLNRASIGVQDFDPDVQRAVNRIQTVEETLAAIAECRRFGFRSVNVDLIFGLPKQTLAGFERTIDTVLKVRPERLAVYSYAHMPELFKAQRRIKNEDMPSPDLKIQLLECAIEKLTAAGYRHIGMDHFALPHDDLARAQESGSLHRNFMGYTTHSNCDLVGLGVTAISHVGNSFSQNARDLPSWEIAIDQGRLPTWRGVALDDDDVLRGDVIQQLMCKGEIDIPATERKFGVDFGAYFIDVLDRLTALEADGLIEMTPTRIAATRRGRYVLRVVAMQFDRYLEDSRTQLISGRQLYSRAV
jgi:oxygen-independent coproporphyrinogen-3 oxidase